MAALWISPRASSAIQTNAQVWTAMCKGGAITLLPLVLVFVAPGRAVTRHVIAVAQMLMSSLLIAMSEGRIETHYYIFGALACLSFYRDWSVLVTASIVTSADFFLGGIFWPQATYGVFSVGPWRWLEQAGWVLFTDSFLFIFIMQSLRETAASAARQAN